MTGTTTAETVDRWIALLAGRDAWSDAERPPSVVARLSAAIELLAMLVLASALWAHRLTQQAVHESAAIRFAPLAFSLAGGILALSPIRVLAGRATPAVSLWWSTLRRMLLVVVLIVSIYAVVPRWLSLVSWPMGVAIGADVVLTSWVIGWDLSPIRWWDAFLRSPIHLGVVGGLLGAAAYQGWGSALKTAMPIYVSLQVWVVIAAATAWSLSNAQHRETREHEAVALATSGAVHRRSAHWLHDDICAQLRLVSLRVQAGGAEMSEVEAMLDDLDYQLRLRQLDELFESGSVRIGEILQPYVRRAQNHGVAIDHVPSFEEASLIVSTLVGRTFARVFAIFTSNALNAGAHHISYEVQGSSGSITIAVIDDAGGFPSAALPIGRGLWSLQQELGDGGLTITPTADGSRVEAVVSLLDRSAHGAAVAR